jgi:hypothetical protein
VGKPVLVVNGDDPRSAPLTQMAFEVTVSYLYASTTFVLWTVRARARTETPPSRTWAAI